MKKLECEKRFVQKCTVVPTSKEVAKTKLECSCPECTVDGYWKEECVNGKTVDFRSGCKDEVCKWFERYETVVTNGEDCIRVPEEVCMDVVVTKVNVVPREVCETVQKEKCDSTEGLDKIHATGLPRKLTK